MNKSLLIFKHEFLRKIKSAGFIILTLSVPVAALLGIGIFKLAKTLFEDPEEVVTAIGYVDEVGMFDDHTDMGVTELVLSHQGRMPTRLWPEGRLRNISSFPKITHPPGSFNDTLLRKKPVPRR